MNGGPSKLGTALIAVFAVCILALIAAVAYVIWRRRRFQRRSMTAGESVLSGDSIYVLPSKELLYLFCWKNQSRIEPNEVNSNNNNQTDPETNQNPTDQVDDELLKLQGLYGQSRLLFTIKEDDDDDDDDDDDEATERSPEGLDQVVVEKEAIYSDHDDEVSIGSTLTDDDVAVSVITVEEVYEATPFSTPCASPPYYTPSPSPSREELNHEFNSHEEVTGPTFVSLEIVSV